MAADIRKINRHVVYRTALGRLRPAVITAVGAGTNVDIRVGHHAETFALVPKWNGATPGTAGWTRDNG